MYLLLEIVVFHCYVSWPEGIRVFIVRGSTKILTTKPAAEDKARRYDDLNESTLHRRKFRKQRLDAIQMLEARGKAVFFFIGNLKGRVPRQCYVSPPLPEIAGLLKGPMTPIGFPWGFFMDFWEFPGPRLWTPKTKDLFPPERMMVVFGGVYLC